MKTTIKYKSNINSQGVQSHYMFLLFLFGIPIYFLGEVLSTLIILNFFQDASSLIKTVIYFSVVVAVCGAYTFLVFQLVSSKSIKILFKKSFVDLRRPGHFTRLRYKKILSYWFSDEELSEEFDNVYTLLEMRTDLGDIHQIPVPSETLKKDISRFLESKIIS